jgi:hypothetical protein
MLMAVSDVMGIVGRTRDLKARGPKPSRIFLKLLPRMLRASHLDHFPSETSTEARQLECLRTECTRELHGVNKTRKRKTKKSLAYSRIGPQADEWEKAWLN